MKYFSKVSANGNNYQEIIDYVWDLVKNRNIILLYGDLGSGKTFFVQRLLRCISDESVTSPTFSLVNLYNTHIGKIYHYDLYRVKHADELVNLDIYDAAQSMLMIVEWPEIAEKILLKFLDKIIRIEITGNAGNSRNYRIDY